jgi:hypothetical protein
MRIAIDANGNPIPEQSQYDTFVDHVIAATKTRDKEVFLFNSITGELDLALKFNENRIVTSLYNAAGNRRVSWDSGSETFVPDGPLIVINKEGNVVVV